MQEQENKTKRQVTVERRRQLLLETAVEAFLELGYQQTGVREIARRAGISLGNLYNHFPGKEDVLVEIARIEAIEIKPIVDQLESGQECESKLELFVESFLRYSAQYENVLLAIEVFSEAIRNPKVAAVFEATRAKMVAALANCLEELQTRERIQNPHKSLDLARMTVDLLEAQARHIVFSERKVTRKDIDLVWTMIGSGLQLKV